MANIDYCDWIFKFIRVFYMSVMMERGRDKVNIDIINKYLTRLYSVKNVFIL